VELLLDLPLEEARRLIPAAYATLEAVPGGVLVHGHAADDRDLTRLAQILVGLGQPLVVLQPPELRDALRALATHAAWLAEREPIASG
jgi:hypothetical protein